MGGHPLANQVSFMTTLRGQKQPPTIAGQLISPNAGRDPRDLQDFDIWAQIEGGTYWITSLGPPPLWKTVHTPQAKYGCF